MTQTTQVTSPAGESIQIVADDEWAETAGVSTVALRQWGEGLKPMLLRALWEHGEFSSPNGRTANEIMTYLTDKWPGVELPGQSNIMSMWNRPVNMPAVITQSNGKRTYSMKLVALPETWHRKLLQDMLDYPSQNGDQPAQVVDADREAAELVAAQVLPTDTAGEWTDADWEQVQLDAPTIYEGPPPLELHVAHQVAMSMLTAVVEMLSAGSADTSGLTVSRQLQEELTQSQHLLSQRLMENDKLRRQLREAGDMVSALKHERDGLRSRLRMTEHNLTEVLKGETAQAVNAEIMKRVDQVMRTAPTAKGD